MSEKIKKLEAEYLNTRMLHMQASENARRSRSNLLLAMKDEGEEEYKNHGIWPWDRVLAIYPDGTHEQIVYRGFMEIGSRLAVEPSFVTIKPETNRPTSKSVFIPSGTELLSIKRCAKCNT